MCVDGFERDEADGSLGCIFFCGKNRKRRSIMIRAFQSMNNVFKASSSWLDGFGHESFAVMTAERRKIMVSGLKILVSTLVCLLSVNLAVADVIFDNFDDGDYTNNPTWQQALGTIEVIDFGNVGNELRFYWNSTNTATLDFPSGNNTPMSVSYKLRLNDDSFLGGFTTYLVDTDTGLEHIEYASAGYGYGVQGGDSTGFHSWLSDGSNFAATLLASNNLTLHDTFLGYNPGVFVASDRKTFRFDFDPVTGVEFYFEGVLMAQWANFTGQSKVNQIKFTSDGVNNNYYMLDDVQVTYEVPEPATMALLAVGGLGLLRRRRER
jgi:hypothetical protein